MTTEDKLKQLILNEYGSVRKFTQKFNLPYATVASIFSKTIQQTSVSTLIKVCSALGISADELINGNIVYLDTNPAPVKVEDLVVQFKNQLFNINITLNDKPLDSTTAARIATYMDVLMEAEKKNKQNVEE